MFKYLSGDFIAQYNKALEMYTKAQNEIDEIWAPIINDAVQCETERLESVIPNPFNPGDRVRLIFSSAEGVVVNCPIHFTVQRDESDFGTNFGPGKYFPLLGEKDEVVITCDGDLRKVRVQIEADELSIDWGLENRVVECWPDELELID